MTTTTPTTTATNATTTGWPRFRADVQDALLAGVDDHVRRLAWDANQLTAARRGGLRRLLTHAVEHSPFHRRRLAGIDVDRVEPSDLTALPVMTKADMMASFDDAVTDRRLTLRLVEEALAATRTEPVTIHGDYIAMATGGSSGQRGVFVYDRTTLAGFASALSRNLMARLRAVGGPPPGGLPIAMVSAASAVHATGLAPALSAGRDMPFRFQPVPVTLPIGEIVERLNRLQAPALYGYASMLARLADEQRAGRLRLSPVVVTSTSETLTDDMRAAISDAFAAPVVNTFGSTEGLIGATAPGEHVLTFNSDMCIVELVDDDDRPVGPGTPSAKVLLTNLYNTVQPLIRYELNDSFTARPADPGHGHLRATVDGRVDDVLRYGPVDVHPLVVRSVLVRTPTVLDYQVRQTARGIDVDLIATATARIDDLVDQLTAALTHAGLPHPDVTARAVATLPRHPETGKLQRFVPLAT
jgi:phenylacetate-coenzyme A ligase PaaK-like adenylate-forming protein